MNNITGKLVELYIKPFSVAKGVLEVEQEIQVKYLDEIQDKIKLVFIPFRADTPEVVAKLRYSNSKYITVSGWYSNDGDSLYFEVKKIID